jgi:uracil-DNA glycosylase family 4
MSDEIGWCTACPLHKGAHTQVHGVGPLGAKFMFVGEAPGEAEDETGQPFIGKAGMLLTKLLRQTSLRREDVFLTNAVRCRPPHPVNKQKKPSAKEIGACRFHLEREIAQVKPTMIVALGDAALKTTTGKSGIKAIRGSIQPLHKTIGLTLESRADVMPTFHPAFALREPAHEHEIVMDIQTAIRSLDGGFAEIECPVVPYERLAPDRTSTSWSFDIETNAREIHDPEFDVRFLCIDDGTKIHYVSHDAIPLAVTEMDEYIRGGGTLVGHNASSADRPWLEKITGVNLKVHDTQLLAHDVDEEQPLKLQDLAVRYLGIAPWKDGFDFAFWQRGPQTPEEWFDAIQYCARDTRYARLLFLKLWDEADPGERNRYVRLELPASRALSRQENKGVYVSVENARRADEEIEIEQRLALIEIKNATSPEFNPGSYDQVRKLLFTDMLLPAQGKTDSGEDSTNEQALKQLWAANLGGTLTTTILKYRETTKLRTTYLGPYLKQALEGWTDRRGNFHPSLRPPYIFPRYSLTNTVTHRTSCFSPNLQNVPRDSRVRSVIAAPPGYVLLEADASQLELRMAAELAPESALFQEYLKPDPDVHMAMAERITGKSREHVTKEERSRAKPPNFAFLYDPAPDAWKTYRRIALTDYDLVVEDREARFAHDAFKEWGLKPWHMRVKTELEATGKVRSIFGAYRRLPNIYATDDYARLEAWRQGINATDQSAASDLVLLWLIVLTGRGLHCVGYIHDAIHVLLPAGDAGLHRYWAEQIKHDFAVTVPDLVEEHFGYRFRTPLVADVSVGRHWGDKGTTY